MYKKNGFFQNYTLVVNLDICIDVFNDYNWFVFKGRDRAWVEDPPARIPYKSLYNDETKEEQGAGTYIFIVLVCVFVLAVVGCIYEVLRSARRDRKRRRALAAAAVSGSGSPGGSKRWQPAYATTVVGTSGVKTVGFKTIIDDEKRPNGTKDYKSVPNSESKNDVANDKKVFIKGLLL